MATTQRIGTGGVEFHRRVTFGQGRRRSIRRLIGIAPKTVHVVVREWVEVRIGPNALIHFTAQKRPDRTVAILAQNIPTGNLEP